MAAVPRYLSDLPDDVLRRILFFAPAREGAATAVLSRRWRWLWCTSGAVNLNTRSFSSSQDEPEVQSQAQPWDWRPKSYSRDFSTKETEGFLHAAGEALAAAASPVKRLTVFIAEGSRIHPTLLEDRSKHDLISAVISNPAARRIEELHIEIEGWNKSFTLSFGSLASETLRTVRIISCCFLMAALPDAAVFQRLVQLHLERCGVPLVNLQHIIDAAPQLETLHLESWSIMLPKEEEEEHKVFGGPVPKVVRHCQLVLPAVTALVFAGYIYQSGKVRLELDAPRLRYFRYEGDVQLSDTLLLKPQSASSSNLARVDLELKDYHVGDQQLCQPFWRFIRNFSTARVLKLQLHYFNMDTVALTDKESQDELLGGLLFGLLERLELQAHYEPTSKTSMVMLANLLHCCPVVRDFRLKLSKNNLAPRKSSIDQEAREDFNNSVDHFRHRRSQTVSLGGGDDGNHEASYVSGLSGESFNCLQSYLRRVRLHFCMEEPNCLGVQLAKFFAENAMVLEELYIHDGSQKMPEHMNTSVGRWITKNSTEMRNFAGVAVLPG
ncbi:unnamed protein product [Urochloa decumbens]|uniref:F-box/LRR-repeat protein 15/At3g58940/PEG3-like LRR domain-containing protein n=1 Tax=Urochloa decumbens TaxID=240449 RepID=A0ABC9AYQ2_9POAL